MPSILAMMEELVRQDHGPTVLATVRAVAAEQQGGSSPGARAGSFVRALSEVRNAPSADVCRQMGKRLAAPLFKELPFITRRYASTRAILLQLTSVSATVMETLLPGSPIPDIDVELLDLNTMRLTTNGSDEVASLLAGLIQGSADHFSERVGVRAVELTTSRASKHALDVVFEGERRTGSGSPPSPPGVERRSGVVGGVTTFLR